MATVNPEVYNKFRNVKKLASSQDEQVQVEVREDKEQVVKLQDIIDILVAAGYFRARIKGLAPFDKIVGGMTWCIRHCNVDVDVDLLFQENSTIGQKIALTEKIVAVLPKMKCPHGLEPHQIQGLDFVHIFPVIQWLVLRSMEFREEMSAFVRSYAVSQYQKEFPTQDKLENAQKQMMKHVNAVREVYKPHRYYRRKTAPPPDLASRVQITLLEYGMHADAQSADKAEGAESLEQQQIDELNIQHLLNSLAETNEDGTEHILNKEERAALTKHYASLQSELEDGGIKSREENKIETLERQKRILLENCEKMETETKTLNTALVESLGSIEELQKEQETADSMLKELSESHINHTENNNLKEVEDLVIKNDSLRAEEMQFRDDCKKELARLQNLIEEAKKSNQPSENAIGDSEEFKAEMEKLRELRLHIAKKNRSIVSIQRKLDEVPSRAELAQYQRRFLELYNQVAAKHKETKQYFTLYNTLEDSRVYIQKELSLLNSICDSYPEAIISHKAKDEFLNQFETIVEGVKQSKAKVEAKLAQERGKRDELSRHLHGLVEQQRRYAAAVKQLSIECKKHETLMSQYQEKLKSDKAMITDI